MIAENRFRFTPLLAVFIGATGPVMPLSAQEVKVRIELFDVRCYDTEDVTGGDEFFVVAAMSDGHETRGIVTRPIDIDTGQNRTFAKDQMFIFEGKLPRGRSVGGDETGTRGDETGTRLGGMKPGRGGWGMKPAGSPQGLLPGVPGGRVRR